MLNTGGSALGWAPRETRRAYLLGRLRWRRPVNDKRVDSVPAERKRFSSKILASWCRKSPVAVTRLTKQWSDDHSEVTHGAGSPAAALAMVFKLVESAQTRWRAITGAHLVALVRSGAKFENGVLVERQEQAA